MLKHGANTWSGTVPTDTSPGKLPLIFALEKGDLGMACLLLQTELSSSRDVHWLMAAICEESLQVLDALFSSPARPSVAELSAMMSLLTQIGLDPDPEQKPHRCTFPMLACQHGSAAAVHARTGQSAWQSYKQVWCTCFTCSTHHRLTLRTMRSMEMSIIRIFWRTIVSPCDSTSMTNAGHMMRCMYTQHSAAICNALCL